MGYNTRYTLEHEIEGFRAALEAHLEYEPFEDDCKWYDHEDDIAAVIKAMSPAPPNGLVCEIHGEGEEQGDVWDKEFSYVNGRVLVVKTAYVLEPGEPEPPRAL